jgi:hypothetical protein
MAQLVSKIAVCFLFLGPVVANAHDHWISHGRYRSPIDGTHCCGDNDCFLVPEPNVKVTPQGYVLETGEHVPYSEALASEDGHYWRCKKLDGSRRCFFAPRGTT